MFIRKHANQRRNSQRTARRAMKRVMKLEALDRREMMAVDLGVIDDGLTVALFDTLQTQVNREVFIVTEN